MSELAQQLIKKAKEKKLRTLDLGNCGLTEFPEEVFEIVWLEKLNLGPYYYNFETGNFFVCPNTGNANSIQVIPNEVAALKSLKEFNIYGNGIIDIRPLASLHNLTLLNLYNNRIEKIDAIAELPGLLKLHLAYNRIKEISSLSGLQQLSFVNLRMNEIKEITPLKELIQKGLPVLWEDSTTAGIVLDGNPLVTPPPEIVKQGNEAILNYYNELEQQGSEHLYEAKLLILGEGGTGKTTLARKLKDNNAAMPQEAETTKGIAIEPYVFKAANGKNFQINVWDFGGQEIYHATHQFFLTKRSLYILVDDTRKDDKSINDVSFNYWLQVVGLFGGGSPLLIVQNEKSDRSKGLDMKGIQGRFDFIKERYSTNLLTGRGLDEVKEAIHFYIQQLPHVGEKLPKNWIAIRKELEKLAKTKDFISIDDYLAICNSYQVDEERALFLSSYLHDLGLFLHFQDGSVLQNIFILNNQWATDAVYKLLDNEKVKQLHGRFNRADLNSIWSDVKYKYKHNELLALMTKFELCYELKDMPDTWLAPQLFPVEGPAIAWDNTRNLIVRYKYDFMPKGLLSRFIVRNHQYSKDASLAWRSGVLLERQNTQALITETYGSREISIRIKGPQQKEFMTLITEDFDAIHSLIFHTQRRSRASITEDLDTGYSKSDLKVEKLIPCNCTKCQALDEPNFYEYEDLKKRKEKGRRTVECKISYEDVDVVGLLEGVFAEIKNGKEASTADTAVRVFLSYSHKDEALKEELDKHLSSLKRSNKIKTWNDRKLGGGDVWDENIKKELQEADIILLLISADFMASEYIWEVEVKTAIERHKKGEAKVIPIFLRACEYDDMPFYKLQGYPKDAKPVKSFPDQDEAFLQVAKGIRADLEAWKK